MKMLGIWHIIQEGQNADDMEPPAKMFYKFQGRNRRICQKRGEHIANGKACILWVCSPLNKRIGCINVKKADINNISVIRMMLASERGHAVISLDQKRFKLRHISAE